jgi:hydrogenase assembly chaperone HypC/HupF
MCLGIPGQVIEVSGTQAKISIRGRETLADASMVPVRPGDFVLVYTGLIVQVLEADEARERLRLLEESGTQLMDTD